MNNKFAMKEFKKCVLNVAILDIKRSSALILSSMDRHPRRRDQRRLVRRVLAHALIMSLTKSGVGRGPVVFFLILSIVQSRRICVKVCTGLGL